MSGVRHLYAHLPFCSSRCGYCAFVVETGGLDRRDAYLDALLAELDQQREVLGHLDTVYLGGGTPSLMRPRRIGRLLDAVGPHLAVDAEVSMEINPETVDRAALRAYREAGVTRASIGVQSFQPHLLDALDRGATANQARAAVECALEAGLQSVSVDLLFGIPGQTPADLEADIAVVRELSPQHVSWYELEIKPGTALERIGMLPPDEDESADAYRHVVGSLEAAGYRWYETANFARPGFECRHSLGYWHARDYLGIGVGAVSTIAGRRWRNAAGVDAYVASVGAPARTEEELDDDLRRRERWMLALRLEEPIDLDRLGAPDHPESLDVLHTHGLLQAEPLALTREGRFVQNSVLHELIEYA
ncbi:MAG: radical SAM family heme chaperone HemW [Thermoleophilia bacterium]|nr:radical SAM family heme chaperone HemW [Thermoleophilia bacterium]